MQRALIDIILSFYDLLWLGLSPFIFVYLCLRRDTRKRLAQLAGSPSPSALAAMRHCDHCLLVHAVSVGEVLSVAPVVKRLKEELALPVILSTTIEDAETITDRVPGTFDGTTFACLDFSPFVSRFISRLRPQAVLVSETDLWPNFLYEVSLRRIPLYLVNGRISSKIATGLSLIGDPAAELLSSFRYCFMQRPVDARRLTDCGLPPSLIAVVGNTKYEAATALPTPKTGSRKVMELIRQDGRSVFVAGSTHPGEERLLFEAVTSASTSVPAPLLVIAPRKVDRASEICEEAASLGLVPARWTELSGALEGLADSTVKEEAKDATNGFVFSANVLVIDVIGELASIYSLADLVFIGGTFSTVGGHNFLEACAHGKAVIVGPDMHNFSVDLELFLAEEAIIQVHSRSELSQRIEELLANSEMASATGKRARGLLLKNRRASSVTAARIRSDLLACRPFSPATGAADIQV